MVSTQSLANELSASIDPYRYLQRLHFDAYEWQEEALNPGAVRLALMCARQSGKSTVIAALVVHRAKYFPGSLILLFAPTEDQATELMHKISQFMSQDSEIILVRDSSETKKLLNGSRIKAFSASPKAARGYSDPDMIIFDEAAQVDRELYMTVRPMMTGGKTTLILLSTPYGKTGFFYETWDHGGDRWLRVLVKPVDVLHTRYPDKYPEEDTALWKRKAALRGVRAYISPRHKKDFLLEELEVMGERWYRQEYGCEFLDPQENVFDMDDVNAMFGHADAGAAIELDNYIPDEVDLDAFWGKKRNYHE